MIIRKIIAKFIQWIVVLRAYSFIASIVPVTLGSVAAYLDGHFSIKIYFLVLLGSIFLHGGTNLINDYFDCLNGIDSEDSHQSSYLILNSVIPAESVHQMGVFLLLAGAGVGVFFSFSKGIIITSIFGFLGALGGYFYTANPINLKYKAFGLPLVFILMGPMMVLGSYYVQALRFSLEVFIISLPIGFLVAAILQSNDIKDINEDMLSGIRTFTGILGIKKAHMFFTSLIIASYLIILFLFIIGITSIHIFLVFLTIPNALKLLKKLNADYIVPETAKFYGQFGLTFIFSYFLSGQI